MKYLLPVIILFFYVSAFSQQPYKWQEATSGGYTYRYVSNDPMKARFYTLSNGLTVILSVNKKEPRIQTLIGVRAGSNNDPKNHTGLAHYLEHLLFKGTFQYGSLDSAKEKPYLDQVQHLYEVYNQTKDPGQRKQIYHQIDSVSGLAAHYAIANEYDKMMTGMGAQGTNAHTSVEETVYEEDIPSNAVDKYIAVQAERFRNPVFRLFHTELEAVYEEKNRGLDNDAWKVNETLMAALFPTHNYGQQTTIGTIDHLKNPSLTAIRDFYNTWYVPNNMAIAMAGDFDPDAVIKKIDEAFSYMMPNLFEPYKGPIEQPLTAPVIKEVKGPGAESVEIAFRLPGAFNADASVVATVVSEILSNGKVGLIDINLNRRQILLGASAGILYMKDYSVLSISGKAREGQKLEEVKELLLEELDKLRQGNFDETMITAIVNNFKLYELQGMEKNNNRAVSLMDAFIKHKGANWDHDVAFVDNMALVNKEKIIRFADQYLRDNYVVVYKRKEDDFVPKVEKPAISPIEVNRKAQSPFVKKIASMPVASIKPQWLNYERDLQKSKIGHTDILYVQNKENSLFHAYYRFNMGSWNNKLLPFAAAYLSFLSTPEYTSEQISRSFYNLACTYSINVTGETTTITLNGLQENFKEAMTLLEHVIYNCTPNEEAWASLRERIKKSRSDIKLSKKDILNGLTQYAVYGSVNPFNYQLTNEELDKVSADQLVAILHELFTYKHTIMYFGPQALPAFVSDIRKLHIMPAAGKTPPAPYNFQKTIIKNNKVYFTPYDMVQAEVRWVRNGDRFNPALNSTVDLFNNYFGGGMGSVVFQTIRESRALAYSTYAYYYTPAKKDDRYTAVAYVGSQADKMKDAIAGMNELLNEMPVSEKAFETARQSLKQDIETERITGDAIIFNYFDAQRKGYKTDPRRSIYNTIDKISFKDIQSFHNKVLSNQPYAYCILASDKSVGPDELKKYGELKALSLNEIFGF